MSQLRTGAYFGLFRNQGMREAFVLAMETGLALVEYEMPAGTTALNVIPVDENGYMEPRDGSTYYAVSYRSVPKHWLKAMIEAGTEWMGYGQRCYRGERHRFEDALAEAGLSKQVV